MSEFLVANIGTFFWAVLVLFFPLFLLSLSVVDRLFKSGDSLRELAGFGLLFAPACLLLLAFGGYATATGNVGRFGIVAENPVKWLDGKLRKNPHLPVSAVVATERADIELVMDGPWKAYPGTPEAAAKAMAALDRIGREAALAESGRGASGASAVRRDRFSGWRNDG